MGNSKYRKGVAYERKIVNAARIEGKIAFRSAGSHSPIDVCVIDILNKEIKFIQCKTGAYSASEIAKVMSSFNGRNGEYKVEWLAL